MARNTGSDGASAAARRRGKGEQQQSVSQRARSRQQAVRPAAQVPKTPDGFAPRAWRRLPALCR